MAWGSVSFQADTRLGFRAGERRDGRCANPGARNVGGWKEACKEGRSLLTSPLDSAYAGLAVKQAMNAERHAGGSRKMYVASLVSIEGSLSLT